MVIDGGATTYRTALRWDMNEPVLMYRTVTIRMSNQPLGRIAGATHRIRHVAGFVRKTGYAKMIRRLPRVFLPKSRYPRENNSHPRKEADSYEEKVATVMAA
jgi:hypothetical protein